MRFSLSTAIFSLAVFAAAVPKPVVKSNGIAIKLTKHTPFPNPHNTVDVDVLKAHVASLNAKVLRGFDNYEKNTGTTHPYAGNGNGMQERGAGIPLTSDRQQIWLGEISIGTPPKTLTVGIVTGASDMLVLSNKCGTCVGHTLWDPDRSSTSRFRTVVNGKPKEFTVDYADETVLSGILYVDNVTISGFTADEQTFGAASTYFNPSQDSSERVAYGQLGLAFQSISAFPIAAKPLLATLVYDEVTEPVFSVMLTSDSDGGELYIGGVNPNLYRGEFTYAYVTEAGYWQVEIQSIKDDKGKVAKIESSHRTNIPAIIDTGCNHILVGDANGVSAIYAALGGTDVGEGFYAFPCNSFPAISFVFDGKSFQIPPVLLNLGKISPSSNECFSAIIAGDPDAPFWIIGNTFLEGYYTTFDFGDNPRVGFAELQ